MNDYKYIIVPIVTLILCQIIKFIIDGVQNNKLDFKRLFSGSGGMPSSHTSLSTSLAAMIFLNGDPKSIEFAISLVLVLIVAYDGMNVRLETGKQAKTLNNMIDSIFKKDKYDKLKEEMGHKPKEVFFGILLGIFVAVIYTYVVL